jgi:crotonobetainyl-CoA:carnitine CoA-transferase CaiB-like acyl-CoA transferase
VFDRVRVLSLAEQYPGPFATSILSDLGADVVLVERPNGGDPSRRFPDFFDSLNRGKRSIALDLKSPDDREVFLSLAAVADVVLEGYRPGVAARLGVGADDIRAVNPDVVYLSISGFGQESPYRDRPGHDISYQALAGSLSLDDGHADPGGLSLGDLAAAMYTATAVGAALFRRERVGAGATIDVAIVDSLVAWMTTTAVPPANGAELGAIPAEPGYGIFTTADGHRLAIAVAHEDHFWRGLAGVTGMPDVVGLAADERLERADELRERIAASVRNAPLVAWERDLSAHDIPHSRVNDPADLGDDPHIVARSLFVDLPSRGGTRSYLRTPLVVDGVRTAPTRRTPGLGEHTAEVIAEWAP